MIDIFEIAKDSICDLSSEMIESLRTSLSNVVRSLAKLKTIEPNEQNKSASRNSLLSIVSIATLVTGGIGIVCGANWAKWLLIVGAGSVGVDYYISSKKTSIVKNKSLENADYQSIPLSERYKIIDILTTVSDEICVNWDSKLASIKDSILKSVVESAAQEDNKVKAKYELYVVNKIDYSMTDWIPRFEAADNKAQMINLISQYGAYFTGQIEKACNKQSLAYTTAGNFLEGQR